MLLQSCTMVRDHNSGERRSAQRVTRADAIYSSVRNGLEARYLTPMKSIAAGHFISGNPQRRSANARSQRPFDSGEQVCRLPRPQAISSRAGLGLNSSQAADSCLRPAPIGISTTVQPRLSLAPSIVFAKAIVRSVTTWRCRSTVTTW